MAKLSLKNIVGRNKGFYEIISGLLDNLSTASWIEDENGNCLMGEPQIGDTCQCPIMLEETIAGWVKGSDKAQSVADLLSMLLQRESAKKKLGNEVLSLYQEINIIFNFTEALTQTIDPDIIASLTLKQAMHSIQSNSGIILLWDEEHQTLTTPAVTGEDLFNQDGLRQHLPLLMEIGLSGQSEIISDIALLKEKGIIQDSVQSLVYAAMKVKHRIMGAVILAGTAPDQFSAGQLKLLVTLALQSSAAIESALLYEKNIREVREREEAILRIHEVTKKFVPNEFIRSLGKDNITDIKLGDQVEKIVTVLFTDIRDFTSLSEKMTPDENFRFVSSFNAQLGPIIRSNNGFINQYLGDSIMAIFPDNPADAIKAAISMQKAVFELNRNRKFEGLPEIRAGIGMHTGPLIMGITGDEQRMDAATIADTVNTAARIESLTKYYRSPLLLSRETINHTIEKHDFNLRSLGNVRLKGKNKLLNIIECFDGLAAHEFALRKETLASFNEAMEHYHDRRFEKAIPLFEKILAINPGDLTGKHFLENAMTYLQEGVPDNWTGAEEMVIK
ncbi:MAG: adenylate/guanylate cyclase [Terrimonas sp.]|nr:adenylate/guanylate cyclase [Terrimonas sp.]